MIFFFFLLTMKLKEMTIITYTGSFKYIAPVFFGLGARTKMGKWQPPPPLPLTTTTLPLPQGRVVNFFFFFC